MSFQQAELLQQPTCKEEINSNQVTCYKSSDPLDIILICTSCSLFFRGLPEWAMIMISPDLLKNQNSGSQLNNCAWCSNWLKSSSHAERKLHFLLIHIESMHKNYVLCEWILQCTWICWQDFRWFVQVENGSLIISNTWHMDSGPSDWGSLFYNPSCAGEVSCTTLPNGTVLNPGHNLL